MSRKRPISDGMPLAFSLYILAVASASAGTLPTESRNAAGGSLPAHVAPSAETFDKARVLGMIREVDRGRNAVQLQYRYFGGRRPEPFDRAAAYQVVKTAAEREAVGCRRWFLLEGVTAYAAFRTKGVDTQEGYDAYARLIPRLSGARPAGLTDWADLVVYDFVSTTVGIYSERESGPQDSRWLVPRALRTHLDLARSGEEIINRIDWAGAIERSCSAEECFNALKSALDDPKFPRCFALLFTAAQVLSKSDPPRSLKMLRQAVTFTREASSRDAVYCYGALSSAAQAAGDMAGAAEAQQSVVRLSGEGSARLAWLCQQAGDRKRYAAALSGLCEASANEQDIDQMFEILIHQWDGHDKNSVAIRDATRLLTSYLSASRTRRPVRELSARLHLGELYIRVGDNGAATGVLAQATAPSGAGGAAAHYYQRILALQRKLGVPGAVGEGPDVGPRTAAGTPR